MTRDPSRDAPDGAPEGAASAEAPKPGPREATMDLLLDELARDVATTEVTPPVPVVPAKPVPAVPARGRIPSAPGMRAIAPPIPVGSGTPSSPGGPSPTATPASTSSPGSTAAPIVPGRPGAPRSSQTLAGMPAARPPSIRPPAPVRAGAAVPPTAAAIPAMPGRAPAAPSPAAAPGVAPPRAAPPASRVPATPAVAPVPEAPKPRAEEAAPKPAVALDHPLVVDALALVRACESELAKGPDARRAARLHYEIARLSESPLGDLRKAAAHYQEAITKAPEHVPTLRGARRTLLARKSYQAALPLFDAEVRITSDPRKKAQLLLAKGRLLEDVLGMRAEAREAYASALELDRGDASLLRAIAQHDVQGEQWDGLARTLEREANAVASDPSHRAQLVVQRARLIEARKGEADAAIELYETALRLDPKQTQALVALKRLLHTQRRWRDLIGVLAREAETTVDPQVRAMGLYRIAKLHAERLGNRDEAVTALEHAIEDAPDDPLVLEELARLYEAAERWEPLTQVLSRLVAGAGDATARLSLLHRIGQLQEEKLRDDEAAARCHEAALALEPTHVPTLQALGKLLTKKQDWPGLVRMHKAEADAADDPRRRATAHARVAEILETHLGDATEAAEHHARALALAPDHTPSFKALTRLYAAANRHRDLVELYERAVDQAPDASRAIAYLFKIGGIYEDALGEHAQAAHAYRRVLALDADHLGAIHALQRATERAGRYVELVEALELEAEKTHDEEQIVALLQRAGEVLDDDVGDRDGAMARFRKALAIRPTYVPTLTALGRIYYRAGRWDDLLELYRRELEVTPIGPRAVALLTKMGELCEERIGRDEEALVCYRRAVEIEPSGGAHLRALARKLREKEQFSELAKVLELQLSALSDAEPRALASYRLGEVYEERLGQPERAVLAYEQALRAVPEHRPSLDALARLRAEQKGWSRLVDDLEREAQSIRDPKLSIAAIVRQGEVWAEELRDPRRAIGCFERVLSEDPGHLGALLALESLYRKVASWDALARVYATLSRVLTDSGARVAALRELGRLQETRGVGAPEDAAATLEALLSLAPEDAGALAQLERRALDTGDRRLLTLVDTRLAETESDPQVVGAHRTRLAESLELSGDRRALEAYRQAVEADPESLGATRGLSRLAEELDDPAALAEAARREASVARDGEVAARLLLRSARVRTTRLGDPKGALADLERALELHPDQPEAAGDLSVMLRESDPARLADLLARAAGSAKAPERVAALGMEVARLQADPLSNVAGAIGTLNRVLRVTPQHLPTLVALARLYGRDGQWTEAANLFGRVVQLAPDRDVLRDTHLELAALWADKLGDGQRALVSLQAVLALDADNRVALVRLAELQSREGDTDRAIETARRLVSAQSEPKAKADALVLVARLEKRRGDASAATKILLEAVQLEGGEGSAAAELKPTLTDRPAWERFAEALREHIRAGNAKPPALLQLAHVVGDELGQTEEPVTLLHTALARGEDVNVRIELARRLRRASRFDEAIREHARVLALDVGRDLAYRELSRTHEAARRTDEARMTLAPLAFLGAATPQELQALAQRPPRPAVARPGAFDADTFRILEAGARHELASALLVVLGEALPKVYPPDLEGYGLSSRDRIAPKSGHVLRVLADRVASLFGVAQYDLYVHRARARGVSVELGDAVSILVPAGLGEVPESAQAFALARVFASVGRGFHATEKLTPREIEVALASAVRTVVPGFGAGLTSEDFLEDQGRRLSRALSRKNRKLLEELAPQYAALPTPDFATFVRIVHQTALRAALLVGDDLVTALELLRRTERDLGALEGAALLRGSPIAGDLVRFWVSEAAHAVRRRTGMAPSHTPT